MPAAKKKKAPTKRKAAPKTPTFDARSDKPNLILGIAFLLMAMLLMVSMLDYAPSQSPLHTTEAATDAAPTESAPKYQNAVGRVGAFTAAYSLHAIGTCVFMLPLYCLWLSYMGFFGHTKKLGILKIVCLALIILCLASLGTASEQMFSDYSRDYYSYGLGGFIGHSIYSELLFKNVGPIGSLIILVGIFLGGNVYILLDNLASKDNLGRFWVVLRTINEDYQASRKQKNAQKQLESEEKAKAKQVQSQAVEAPPPFKITPIPGKAEKKAKKKKAKKADVEMPIDAPAGAEELVEPPDEIDADFEKLLGGTTTGKKTSISDLEPEPEQPKAAVKVVRTEQTKKASAPLRERQGDYIFPPMSMLQEAAADDGAGSEEDYEATMEMLVQTLAEFGVKVTAGEVHIGPVITRYDVHPAAGVRVEKIQNLDKNISLSLKALSVRILAPVPGRGCVGIEVPNKKPQSVCIRDILESEDWVQTKADIPIALGKDVSGKPLIDDLAKMPHLLIAGSTGSGKTVCINSVVASLLYHSSPEDLRFVMVDPKIVEMQVYNALPHMMIPVVTDPKKVPGALKYLLKEMERRYQMFAGVGVRNIAGYNAKMAKKKDAEAEEHAAELDAQLSPEERAALSAIEVPRDAGLEEDMPEKLPYIVCIVDELADLMMVAPADIETGIARLAQLARAAGIHLILATQRPSVNVITGVIKANLPSRISFKVASKVDSRTILDTQGADQLIGRGDMLFLPPGSADLVRSQGAFVADEEISEIVEYISEKNGDPVFDEQFQATVESGGEDGGGSGDEGRWDDELVPQALDVIRSSKRASTSMLQRRLKIGYNRAARIMEALEEEGIVGPENGSSPREILMDMDDM